jgi:hypothetical protein
MTTLGDRRTTMKGRIMRSKLAPLWILAAALASLTLAPGASAQISIQPGTFKADTFDPFLSGPNTQAGAHPFAAMTAFRLSTDSSNNPTGALRDVQVNLPDGFVADPEAVPTCPRAQFDALVGDNSASCPPASQVGVVRVEFNTGGDFVPLYNLEPRPGEVADLGFIIVTVPVHIVPKLDASNNYAIRADIVRASRSIPFVASEVTLWGVPADPGHDSQRACEGQTFISFYSCSVPVARKPFVTNPANCSAGPLTSTLALSSWQEPERFVTDRYTSATGVDGCDRLAFEPTASIRPSTTEADAPSGLVADLQFPANSDPDGLSTPPLRTAKVTLPEGMSINPGSADGLDACTDAQLGLKTDRPVGCPDSAKIGTVTAKSPVLEDPLVGSVYLRSQSSDDPESGEMFRLALVLESRARGVLIKLPGSVFVNKDTGRVVTQFDNNPQMPVSTLSLQLKSGPRAPLATPSTCGEKTVDVELSSWAGQTAHLTDTFAIACRAGLGDFTPSLSAGTTNAKGGAFSPFAVNVDKPDGNTPLTGLRMELPEGLTAKIAGNLNTQVGTATVSAGPGGNPFNLPGKVFLEGAYGDAPFSLRVVVPAKAGPFDLGEVVVRQKIYVDPIDAHVTVVSDPLPTIVKGVPVRLQRVVVDVDKPGFMINPTSCESTEIKATLSSATGQSVPVTNRFQVGDCASLALKPSLGLTLSGKGQTTDGKHPAVTASLTQPAGQANLKKVRVALPLSLALDPDNANGLCEFADGSKAAPTCPKNSIVGTAMATTPILDEPLSGPVYFVKNVRKDPKSGREIRTLPKLVIPLVGQNGVKLTLTGTSAVANDQLVTTFDNIPDAPVSSFKLNINGGKGGILTVSDADICKSTQIADQQIDGQNDKQANSDVYLQTPSCPLKVLSKRVTAKAVTLKVGGLGAGKVTVTGKGIKKTTKTITKSTVGTITAKRTKGKPGKVKVSFVPAGTKKAKTAGATLR